MAAAQNTATPTEPPEVPRQQKRELGFRTRLVRRTNEQQLELPWTEAKVYTQEIPDSEPAPVPESQEVAEATAAVVAIPDVEVAKRAYPLAYDPEGPAGPALDLLGQAREQAQLATEAYTEGDMATVGNRLSTTAALLAKAYPHTAFNAPLGAAVSFLRRATLLANAMECGFEELMGLAKATRHLAENPLISLDDSAELVMQLETQGWVGADPEVAKLVAALFGDVTRQPLSAT